MSILERFRRTLVMQFTIMILLILVVGQGILYLWLLLYQKSYLEEHLHAGMAAVARQLADITAAPDSDPASLHRSLDLVLRTGDILSVRVTDGSGRTLAERTISPSTGGNAEGPAPPWPFSVPARSAVRAPLRTGGSVELVYSGRSVNEVMSRFLVIPPVMQFITFLVVITAILLFFRRKVASPVAGINAALSRITEGDLVAPVPAVDGEEIGSIAAGVRFLAEKLSASLTRVHTLSNDVGAALERLTAALSVVRDATRSQAASIDNVMAVIRQANEQQRSSTEGTDRLSHAAFDNASALLEMRSAADEIAASTDRLFRSAADSHAMISEMSRSSMSIAESSGEVFLALESTSSSIDEISASLSAVRENARRSAEFSAKVRQLLSERGTLAVADAIDAMERIAGEVDRFEQTVRQLDLRSKDIEGVLTVINDVTERTKLLSLNASILAAQAGEQGRGFAVVAEEIRSLSEGTTSSAKDIASIVRSIRSQIKDAADAVHTGVRNVDEGKDLIAKSGEAMGEILEAAQKSAQMTNVVEKATSEQAEGLLHIRVAMDNVRTMLEQIAKNTEEERRNASRMLDTIAGVKEVAEVVKRGTGEHAQGTQAISRNLEESRDMVARVHRAAQDQLTANEAVVSAVEQIRRTGLGAMEDLEGLIRSFSALKTEVEALKSEMAFFRTERS